MPSTRAVALALAFGVFFMAFVITVERLALSCNDEIYCRGERRVAKRPEAFKHDNSQQTDGELAFSSIEAPSDILSMASVPEPAGRSKKRARVRLRAVPWYLKDAPGHENRSL